MRGMFSERFRHECCILIAVGGVLALPGPSLAQPERPRAVVTTPHFAFFSDQRPISMTR